MQNSGLDEVQAGIKIAGRNINTSDMLMTPPLWQKERGTKEPLDEGERGELAWNSTFKKTKILASSPIISWQINGETMETLETLFSLSPKLLWKVTAAMKSKDTATWKKSYDKHRQYIKRQKHYCSDKGSYSQSYGFSSSHVWMWELDHKESWTSKNWCFLTVVLEKTLGNPLDCKEIQPVNPQKNQSWIFIGRTDVEAETPKLWPPNVKSLLVGKELDAGKDWRQEEKGMTEDEMVGWHHWLNGHEFEHVLGDGEGKRSLACCSPWGHKEWDMTK